MPLRRKRAAITSPATGPGICPGGWCRPRPVASPVTYSRRRAHPAHAVGNRRRAVDQPRGRPTPLRPVAASSSSASTVRSSPSTTYGDHDRAVVAGSARRRSAPITTSDASRTQAVPTASPAQGSAPPREPRDSTVTVGAKTPGVGGGHLDADHPAADRQRAGRTCEPRWRPAGPRLASRAGPRRPGRPWLTRWLTTTAWRAVDVHRPSPSSTVHVTASPASRAAAPQQGDARASTHSTCDAVVPSCATDHAPRTPPQTSMSPVIEPSSAGNSASGCERSTRPQGASSTACRPSTSSYPPPGRPPRGDRSAPSARPGRPRSRRPAPPRSPRCRTFASGPRGRVPGRSWCHLCRATDRPGCTSGRTAAATVVRVFVLGIDPGLSRCGYGCVEERAPGPCARRSRPG